jgi:hypothetical protein
MSKSETHVNKKKTVKKLNHVEFSANFLFYSIDFNENYVKFQFLSKKWKKMDKNLKKIEKAHLYNGSIPGNPISDECT